MKGINALKTINIDRYPVDSVIQPSNNWVHMTFQGLPIELI